MNRYLLGLAGIIVILGFAFLLSSNRRAIRLRVVGAAFALQAGIAVLVLYTPWGIRMIQGMAAGVANLLGYANRGTEFLFGPSETNPLANTFAIAALRAALSRRALALAAVHRHVGRHGGRRRHYPRRLCGFARRSLSALPAR